MSLPYESQNISIKQWNQEDRPREKLMLQGRRSLTDAELIAILIGSGNRNETAVELSKRMLSAQSNQLNQLAKLSVQELSTFKGIGEAKAISIIAALELGRRRKEEAEEQKSKIGHSKDAFSILGPYFADLNHEEFWIILLNRANTVLSKHLISKGGQAGTIADPKIIFHTAISHHAASLILAHNHPSGNTAPSQADKEQTQKLVSAARLLDLSILDHLIFANRAYFSFADEGLL